MTQPSQQPPVDPGPRAKSDYRRDNDYCTASGLRRKFLDFCEENPAADECRIYET